MPTERDELRLTVTLVDNVSAGLNKIKGEFKDLTEGSGKQHAEKFKKENAEATAVLKRMGGEAGEVYKAFGMMRLGALGAAGGVALLGFEIAKQIKEWGQLADKIRGTSQVGRLFGIKPEDLRNIQEQLEAFGVSAESSMGALTKFMDTMGRLQQNPVMRHEILKDVFKGDPNAEREMERRLNQIDQATSAVEKLNLVRQLGIDVEQNALKRVNPRTGKTETPEQAALERRQIEERLGYSPQLRMAGQLKDLTEEQRKAEEARTKNMENYANLLGQINKQWEEINKLVNDSAFSENGIMVKGARILLDVVNQIKESVEYIHEHSLDEFFGKKMETIRKGEDPISKYIDEKTSKTQENAQQQLQDRMEHLRKLGTPPQYFSSGGGTDITADWPGSSNIEDRRGEGDDRKKYMTENTAELKRLNDFLIGPAAGGGAGGGGGGGNYGFLSGGGAGGGFASRLGGGGAGGINITGGGGMPGSGPGTPGLPDLPTMAGDSTGTGRGHGGRFNVAAGTRPIGAGESETVTLANGKQVTVNKRAAAQFKGFFDDLIAAGAPVHGLGGVGARGNPSQHPIGLAVDWAQHSRNVTDRDVGGWIANNRDKLNAIEQKWGMSGGEHWKSPDTGHFSIDTLFGSDRLKAIREGLAAPAPGGSAAGNAIARERARSMAELKDPETRKLVASVIDHEQAGGAGKADVLESLINRSVATGKSLKQLVHSGFYGPVNRGELHAQSDAQLKEFDKIAAEVAAGRNEIGGRTDQGQLKEVAAAGRKNVRGEYYGWMHLKREQQTAAARAGRGERLDDGVNASPVTAEQIASARRSIDKAETHKVEGSGKITVDVNAPKGTNVGAEAKGLFKSVAINRQTQMEPARRGPGSSSASAAEE